MRLSGAAGWVVMVAMACAVAVLGAAEDFPYELLAEEDTGEYSVRCVVEGKWAKRAEVRLAFDVQDDRASLGYVCLARGKASLVRVTPEGEEQVGEPVGFRPPKQCEVTVHRREGRVRVIVDRGVLLDVPWAGPLGGSVGAGSNGKELTVRDVLLQPVATPDVEDGFARGTEEMGSWEAVSGRWANTMITVPKAEAARSANPFSVRAEAEGEALLTSGYWFWDAYRFGASVKPGRAAAVGVCAYVAGPGDQIQFRCAVGRDDAPRGRQLVLVRGGEEEVLAAGPGSLAPGMWYRLELRVEPGNVRAFVDRDPVLSAETKALGQGGVGLWARGGEAFFDDALVIGPDDMEPPADVTPVFMADERMTQEQLFAASGSWSGDGSLRWHRGEFFDDAIVTLPADSVGTGEVSLLLRADGQNAASGYVVALSRQEQQLSVALSRQGNELESATHEAGAGDAIAVRLAGKEVALSCGGVEVIRRADEAPPTGRKIGLTGELGNLPDTCRVASWHHRDDTFHRAPTDWFAGKGAWRVTTRWTCQPGWTFFGGTRDENPTLWTKHSYRGDIVLEAFANIPMDLPPGPGYSRPSDVNLALCGDGRDLGSGYTFIFAGWKNTKTAILRRGQILAETSEVVFENPTSANGAFHNHWFRVRAEKAGGTLRLWIDDGKVLECTDPEPLAEGRAGLWSFHNGLMVARAQLWFEEELPARAVAGLSPAGTAPGFTARVASEPPSDDFEQGVGEWHVLPGSATSLALDDSTAAGGKRSLRIANAISGGPFGTYAVTTPFRVIDWPRMQFDYRIPPAVRVSIYVYLERKWHTIRLTAAQDSAPVLGEIAEAKADGEWHHAEFDLMATLQKLYPELQTLTVKYIAFGAPEESYVRCGIGGNFAGSAYWIDNFQVGNGGDGGDGG